MGENLVRILDQVIEQLRCSQCKGYLSCGPVRLLADGTSICGQCSPPNSDVVYRELILEKTILKNVAFPCRFKTKGCRSNVAFGQAMEHESKCFYQSHHFPLSVPDETCSWSFGVLKDDLVLLVTYLYQSSTHNLNYDVSYFSSDDTVSATYNIDIENNEIPNCYFSLKENHCLIFDSCFGKLNNMLNLNKYIEALDNPNSIKINIILKDTTLKKSALETVTRTLTVKQKLASLQCRNCCEEYLVFPIFDVEQNKTVCFKCAYAYSNRKESTDMKLRQRIAETNFSCRWQDCNFIGTGDIIRTHEISCQFRDYCCPICGALIKATFADEHLQNHKGTYRVSRDTLLLRRKSLLPQFLYRIENNKVIIVKSNTYPNTFKGELLLSTLCDEKVIVQFYSIMGGVKVNLEEFILSKNTPRVHYKQMLPPPSGLKMLHLQLRSCK